MKGMIHSTFYFISCLLPIWGGQETPKYGNVTSQSNAYTDVDQIFGHTLHMFKAAAILLQYLAKNKYVRGHSYLKIRKLVRQADHLRLHQLCLLSEIYETSSSQIP